MGVHHNRKPFVILKLSSAASVLVSEREVLLLVHVDALFSDLKSCMKVSISDAFTQTYHPFWIREKHSTFETRLQLSFWIKFILRAESETSVMLHFPFFTHYASTLHYITLNATTMHR